MGEELFTENGTYILTDEDGKESEFDLIGRGEIDGRTYLALIPLEDNDEGCYVVLRLDRDENGDEILVSIEDDDEFDKAAAYFDEKLIPEIDYDDGPEEE